MRRRSKPGREPVKARRRKAATPKRRNAPKAVRRRSSSAASLHKKVALLTRERDEALARQTATSKILRVISQSPNDERPVFDSIVLTAARLLRCDLVLVLLCDGATYSHAAVASPEGPFEDDGPTVFPIDPSANFPSRAIVDKKMLHLPDWSLIDLPEHELKIRQRFGVNSALHLPLLRRGECIGLLTLVGKRPNMFGAAEIAQAESFRDQALIAIENARLFKETKEALEQQTATSEVLQVISSSPGDLEPVFAPCWRRPSASAMPNWAIYFTGMASLSSHGDVQFTACLRQDAGAQPRTGAPAGLRNTPAWGRRRVPVSKLLAPASHLTRQS